MENRRAQKKQVSLNGRNKRRTYRIIVLSFFFVLVTVIIAWIFVSRGWIPRDLREIFAPKRILPRTSEIASWMSRIDSRTVTVDDMVRICDTTATIGQRGLRLAVSKSHRILVLSENQGLHLLSESGVPESVDQSSLAESKRPNELVDIAYNENFDLFFAVDKMNNIYSVDPDSACIKLEKAYEADEKGQDAQYAALASDGDLIFLLDPNLNTIWIFDPQTKKTLRWPALAKNPVSWRLGARDFDLTGQVGLAVDQSVFLIDRFGEILELASQGKRKHLTPHRRSFFPLWEFGRPTLCERRIHRGGRNSQWLMTVDNATGRLILFDKKNNLSSAFPDLQIFFREDARPLWIQDVSMDEKLFLLTPEAVFIFPKSGTIEEYFTREESTKSARSRMNKLAIMIRSNAGAESPWFNKSLRQIQWIFPLIDIRLPEYLGVFPGALRGYRFGIHQGVDLYDPRNGYSTSFPREVVWAAADGIISYVSHYSQMSEKEYKSIIEQCKAEKSTPSAVLEKLNGNSIVVTHQQYPVRIETRYSHLANISESVRNDAPIKAGDILGLMGNSGTSDEMKRKRTGIHLHFELSVDGKYLGYGLSHYQTMILFHQLFRRYSYFSSLPKPNPLY